MATIQRPKNQSTWEYLTQTASDRLSAYLTGQYSYIFANTTNKTVKMHLSDDDEMGSGSKLDFFLTVPAHSSGVEVPMKSTMILVTAGFFHLEAGSFEVFWQQRRFAWESGCILSIGSRHSVDANKFRIDVYPGAPEAPQKGTKTMPYRDAQVAQMLMLPGTLAAGPRSASLKGLRVYSQALGQNHSGSNSTGSWVGGEISRALPDGSLEVCGLGGTLCVRPMEEAAIVSLPRGTIDWPALSSPSVHGIRSVTLESEKSDMAPPPANRQHFRDKIIEAAGLIQDTYATFSTAAPSPVPARGSSTRAAS